MPNDNSVAMPITAVPQQELFAARVRREALLDVYQQYLDETQSSRIDRLAKLAQKVRIFDRATATENEELQATNEELAATNDDLQARNTQLQEATDVAASIVDSVQEPLLVLDDGLCVIKANGSFCRTFRHSESDIQAHCIYDLAQGAWDVPALRDLLEKVLLDTRPFEDFELEHEFHQTGRRISLCINARRLNDGGMILMSIEDITVHKRAEVELVRIQDELRQGQKMEGIGRLAGGVAHDFNNMLTAILGFSGMLMEGLEEGTETFQHAAEIMKARQRAATLTNQLLAFSRHLVIDPQVLNLNALIADMLEMLRRLIGNEIVLERLLDDALWPVHADPGEMSQVILNLVLNARDAMPLGGVLTIRTENTVVNDTDGTGVGSRGLAPGSYASLTVTDSGNGMDKETQNHIFEPYFTTKPIGFGTGLGLGTVANIVKQSGGSIQFASELGRGTIFWVDFPRAESHSAMTPVPQGISIPRGTETVLVVENESGVRRLVVQILKRQGYKVLVANQGDEGLALCRSHTARIDLFVTNMVMSGGSNGRQLADQAIRSHPEMAILLMATFKGEDLSCEVVTKNIALLRKPFTLQELAVKVRDTLDRAKPMSLTAIASVEP